MNDSETTLKLQIDHNFHIPYLTSVGSRAGPISDRVVNPVALPKHKTNVILFESSRVLLSKTHQFKQFKTIKYTSKQTYPRPRPGT